MPTVNPNNGPYAQALVDLDSMSVTIQTGDQAFFAGNFALASSIFKSAGAFGVGRVGPDIMQHGAPGVSAPITQAAQINLQLQAASAGTDTDAISNRNLVGKMKDLYSQAIAAGSQAYLDKTSASLWWALGIVGAAGIGAYVLLRRRR
jgi:hypothetical protein